MVQFCHERLYLGIETVSCCVLLLLLARVDIGSISAVSWVRSLILPEGRRLDA